ncbi:MAG TPA: hypothetical protein DCL61_29695, partial [Cyanobacteria bacterium UBA12227]|nr:hypothetical protein [Cyanobacteria bacterium UBA12227]
SPRLKELTYTQSQSRYLIRIKASRLPGKSSPLSQVLNRATHRRDKTIYLDFYEIANC